MAAQNTDLVDQLPLKGVVLCCTSLPQDVRTKLADTACQMGAVHKLDLTADVTHLVVANITTPKYRYVAKERPDMRVLSPDFIEIVRKAWMEGGDIDVEALEKEYALPPFFGLHVCFTGFHDQPERSNMEQTVTSNGGHYHGDLTKVVTHLIAATPEGAKYTFAKQWNIPVVSRKWYEDSLTRGMALQEDLYPPELPLEQQGKNAFRTTKRTSLGKRTREGDRSADNADSNRRKLRKSASMRFDSQSQDMWQSISAQEIQVEATELDAWNDESQTLRKSERPQSEGKSASSRPITPMGPTESDGLFSGHYVLIHGFETAKAKTLKKHLEPNGAVVVSTPEDLDSVGGNIGFHARCLLTPHEAPASSPDVPPGTMMVSEWWVERCIHFKRRLDPAKDFLSSPIPHKSASSFADVRISTTGFDSVDLLQTSRAVKLMGATYEEGLQPGSSVLVCGAENVKREKTIYAQTHNIPIVSADWLWTSLRTRRMAPFDRYKIEMPPLDPNDLYGELSGNTAAHNEKAQLPIRGSGENAKRTADLLPLKRLSNTRMRHATPSLPLQPSKPSERKKARPGAFILEDDDDEQTPIVHDDQPTPVLETIQQPLKDISPNRSQPRKDAENDKDKDDTAEGVVTEKPSAPPHRAPTRPRPAKDDLGKQPKKMEELTSDLASILARQHSSRPGSSTEPQKRKHRPLGRNLSTISNHSGTSASPNLQSEIPESSSAVDGFAASREVFSLPPSTQLGYDTPEAEAHRRKLCEQMGTSFQEEGMGKRVASVGTVKDSAEIASRTAVTAAGRTKARRGKT